ncbi:hypothetical protein FPV67DRAFT_1444516 [Lyophyllum atratum]|nr:hypothetical protein FPV67DRAFT_1444516 [Lyophyllum atratum]
MDFFKGGNNKSGANATQETTSSGSGGGFMGKINSAMGGGQAGEKNEDYLDKAVDFAQERMGGGQQSNESAVEQAKDEQISDAIRSQYKNASGKEFPIADKS